MLVTLSGPAGSGKSVQAEKLVEEGFTRLVSITTRPVTAEEEKSGEYRHVPLATFEEMVHNGDFAWHIERYNNHYGTPKRALMETLQPSPLYVATLTVDKVALLHGISIHAGLVHHVRSIYLFIKDEQELKRRLTHRNRAGDIVAERLDFARWNDEARQHADMFCWINAKQSPDEVRDDALRYIYHGTWYGPPPR